MERRVTPFPWSFLSTSQLNAPVCPYIASAWDYIFGWFKKIGWICNFVFGLRAACPFPKYISSWCFMYNLSLSGIKTYSPFLCSICFTWAHYINLWEPGNWHSLNCWICYTPEPRDLLNFIIMNSQQCFPTYIIL